MEWAKVKLKCLVENELGRTRSDRDGTTVRARTGVDTVFVLTSTVNRRAISGNNLDVEVWWGSVVWVWNDR